jgi:putative addiction module CopG family antidote
MQDRRDAISNRPHLHVTARRILIRAIAAHDLPWTLVARLLGPAAHCLRPGTGAFPTGRGLPMICCMDDITLTPDLERFATEAVAAGRYRDMSEVARAGLSLLQQTEAELADFVASLDEARAEGERDGFLSGAQVETRVRAAIAKIAARSG